MTSSTNTASAEIWQILREVSQTQKELGQSQKKTEESLRELHGEHKKTEESLRELHEVQRRTEKSLEKTNGNFNNKWGTFMEDLVKGDLVKLLNERKIRVKRTSSHLQCYRSDNSTEAEFDLVADNGEEVVVVEVKTTLTGDKIDKFIKKLKGFKKAFPQYKDKKVYGCVAHLGDHKDAVEEAEKNGLFIIKAPGGTSDVSTIVNPQDFKPKQF